MSREGGGNKISVNMGESKTLRTGAELLSENQEAYASGFLLDS